MRSRRDALALGLLILSLLALALLVRPRVEDRSDLVHLSTYRLGPNGARALFHLVEELGYAARRSHSPGVSSEIRDAIVLLAPAEQPTPREAEALLAWVREGGTLLYGAGARETVLPGSLGLAIDPLRAEGLGALGTQRWPGATAYPHPHPWTVGAEPVTGFGFAFRSSSPVLRSGEADVLLRTEEGAPVVVTFALGRGRVVAWSDPRVLGNRLLAQPSSALLFARAADEVAARGGVLWFDEYHQGFREGGGVTGALRRFVTGTAAGRWFLQATAAGLLLLLLAAHRFGDPIAERGHWRRSPLEHVEAVAAAYERAGARSTARRLLRSGLERRIGLRPGTHADSLPMAGAGSAVAETVATEWDRGDTGNLVALAAALDRYEAETRRWT